MAEVHTVTEEQELPETIVNGEVHADAMDLADDADGRSSSLSDIEDRVMADVTENRLEGGSEVSEDGDTEAETERLEASPQKDRKQKTIKLKPMQAEASGNKTSAAQQVVAEDEPTSSISSLGDSVISSSHHSTQSSSPKKRKRSTQDSIESDGDVTTASLNKVSKNLAAHLKSSPSGVESDVLPRNTAHHRKSPATNAPALSLPRNKKPVSVSDSRAASAQRSSRASHDHDTPGTKLGSTTNNSNGGQTHEDETATVDGNEGANSNDEDVENADGDAENDVDVASRNDEEAVKKTSAMRSLNELEQCFAHLRDKLYDDRLAQFNSELNALKQPNPNHPEYLAMMACIDKKRDDQVEQEEELYRLKSELIKRKSVADRAVALGQYMQTARQIREDVLEKANEEWYQLQRERRTHASDQPNYIYAFRKKRSQQIMNQMSYNTEVSILSGFAKYVGFPAAPEITQARQNEIEDDLRAMDEAKTRLYPTIETARPTPLEAQPFRPPNLNRIQSSLIGQARNNPVAEEQFLERTPWANPQHPAHQQQQSNPAAFRRFPHQHQHRPQSPYSTPAAQQRNLESVNHGSASTIPDGYSAHGSSMAATPATGETVSLPMATRAVPFQETPSRPPPSRLQHSLLNGTPLGAKSNGIEEARAYISEPVSVPPKDTSRLEHRSSLPQKMQVTEPQGPFESLNPTPLASFQSTGV